MPIRLRNTSAQRAFTMGGFQSAYQKHPAIEIQRQASRERAYAINDARKKRTHCANGHKWTPETTGYKKCDGYRFCVICKTEQRKKAYQKRKNKTL